MSISNEIKRPKVIALDFDGCLVTDKWPDIGDPIPSTIQKVEAEIAAGSKIILWTCRCGDALSAAVNWCFANGIHLDAVNANLPERIEQYGVDSRKISADVYWDDRAVLTSAQDIGEFSDGFHTFNSLYEQRCVLFAALVNTFPESAWKSRKHFDGEPCFGGGWFIVGMDTPEGSYTYHYEDENWDMFHCQEFETAKPWDGHTDADVKRLLSLCDPEESTMLTWAENEVRAACLAERADVAEGDIEWDYGCSCYESAFRAFKSLLRDGHSGFSISVTKHILNRLIENKCLKPIEDTDDIWTDVSEMFDCEGKYKTYQCIRMSSLFKYVYANGKVKYVDVANHLCVDVNNQSTYTSSLVSDILDAMFPVSMPYMPGDAIKVYCEDFVVDPATGDFDTVGVFYAMKDGEKIEINRFFKENGEGWTEINVDDYNRRKDQATTH